MTSTPTGTSVIDREQGEIAKQTFAGTPFAQKFTGPWAQLLLKVLGSAQAAKVLAIARC